MDAATLAKINDLWSAISTVQQSVTLSITIMTAALGFVATAAGTALYFLARTWIQQLVDRRVKEIEQSLRQSITDDVMRSVKQKYQAEVLCIGSGNTFTLPMRVGINSNHVAFFVRPHNQEAKYQIEQSGQELRVTNLDKDFQFFDVLAIDLS